jgi:hypothetical protein
LTYPLARDTGRMPEHLNGTSFTPVPLTGNQANLYVKEHETLSQVYLLFCNLCTWMRLLTAGGELPLQGKVYSSPD